MTLDHLTIPVRDRRAAAERLASILGVPWAAETGGLGPFSPVYVNDSLTIDFDETADPLPILHYCFRVSDADFDALVARLDAAGIPYRSAVRGPTDHRTGTFGDGRLVYWNEPEGHQWEALTARYPVTTRN